MDKTQTFRSPLAVVVWIGWLLFAVGNWVDLAVQGRDHGSAVAAAILLLATGVAYVTAFRPRIVADAAGVTVRNPLRDHRAGWAAVAKVDLHDLLRVHYDRDAEGQQPKVVSAWAVVYSRRRKLAVEARARRRARSADLWGSAPGPPSGGGRGRPYAAAGTDPGASAAEAEAERIVRVLTDFATSVRAETAWAAGQTGTDTARPAVTAPAVTAPAVTTPAAAAATGSEPLRSTWNPLAIAALAVPALILLAVILL